jgi:hypothetical protein
MVAEHDGKASHSLSTDQPHFDLLATTLNGDDRGKTGVGKVDSINPLVRPFEVFSQVQTHGFEMRLQHVAIG